MPTDFANNTGATGCSSASVLARTGQLISVCSMASVLLASALCAKEPAKADADLRDHVVTLVKHLDHHKFRVREKAQRDLTKLGDKIVPLLDKMVIPDTPEVAWRIKAVRNEFTLAALVGSRWNLVYLGKNSQVELYANGKMYSANPNDRSPGNESWEFDTKRGVIRLHFNNKYATYEGKLTGGTKITGQAHNAYKTWPWSATRVGTVIKRPADNRSDKRPPNR